MCNTVSVVFSSTSLLLLLALAVTLRSHHKAVAVNLARSASVPSEVLNDDLPDMNLTKHEESSVFISYLPLPLRGWSLPRDQRRQ
jgi:hypothetical protein